MIRRRRPPGGYEIGYSKPPRASRFKKGKSGNPTGRPKFAPNVRTSLERALTQVHTVTIDGRRVPMSVLEIALRKQAEKAASGDTKAVLALIELARELAPGLMANVASRMLSDPEKKVLEQFAARFGTRKMTVTHSRPPQKGSVA